ncbi:MAG: amino acid adenylation domain-containing protein [Betaproteobacteria bacterium]
MNMLLQHGVTAQAEARPEAIALVGRSERITYGTLERDSNRLARLLIESGCGRGERVALLMPKVPQAIIAMLATLKAGAIYVPLDPAGPPSRLARMLEISDCCCILACGPVEDMLRETLAAARLARQPVVGWLQGRVPEVAGVAAFGEAAAAGFPDTLPPCDSNDGDLAHILFTSGSTGLPKGVMIAHRSVVHFIDWARAYFGTAPGERISQHPPFHFDLSTFDIYGTLWAGAELHLVPPELNLLPHKLARFIAEAELTQWFSVPSVLNLMAKYDVVPSGSLPSLERVMWCGEAMPTPTLIYLMQRLPHARFTNLYGPTEATIASSYYTVPGCPRDERVAIPIGTPCDGEALLVLDEALRPVAAGDIGDLYISGVGLSPGYWRDPDKTRAAFLPRPGGGYPDERIYRTGDLARVGSDGLVYFLGRADSQIKSRGYRIELGEIEAAANATGWLRECAVVAFASNGFEGHAICCAYTPLPDVEVTPARLRERLRSLLPAYMLPTHWRAFEFLPKNPNGKIDRPALRAAFQQPSEVLHV